MLVVANWNCDSSLVSGPISAPPAALRGLSPCILKKEKGYTPALVSQNPLSQLSPASA